MAFSVREISIHLAGDKGVCHPASPGTATERTGCQGRTDPGGPRTKPDDDKKPEGKKERSLALLQTRLRETLAPPPV